jgi:hypothetical protein
MALQTFACTAEQSLRLFSALHVDETKSTFAEGKVYIAGVGLMPALTEELKSEWWGPYGYTTWLDTSMAAVKEAMQSYSRGVSASSVIKGKQHYYLVASIDLTGQNLLALVGGNRALSTATERHSMPSWRIKGDLQLAGIKTSVELVTVTRLGSHAWADMMLGNRDSAARFCTQCGGQRPTWHLSCAECWLQHQAAKEAKTPLPVQTAAPPTLPTPFYDPWTPVEPEDTTASSSLLAACVDTPPLVDPWNQPPVEAQHGERQQAGAWFLANCTSNVIDAMD